MFLTTKEYDTLGDNELHDKNGCITSNEKLEYK